MIVTSTLYVVYNAFGPGHYDGTLLTTRVQGSVDMACYLKQNWFFDKIQRDRSKRNKMFRKGMKYKPIIMKPNARNMLVALVVACNTKLLKVRLHSTLKAKLIALSRSRWGRFLLVSSPLDTRFTSTTRLILVCTLAWFSLRWCHTGRFATTIFSATMLR